MSVFMLITIVAAYSGYPLPENLEIHQDPAKLGEMSLVELRFSRVGPEPLNSFFTYLCSLEFQSHGNQIQEQVHGYRLVQLLPDTSHAKFADHAGTSIASRWKFIHKCRAPDEFFDFRESIGFHGHNVRGNSPVLSYQFLLSGVNAIGEFSSTIAGAE